MTDIKSKKYSFLVQKCIEEPFVTYKQRIELLKKLLKIVRENEEQISKSLYLDLNKHTNESYFSEIGLVIREIRKTIKNLKKWMKPKRVKTPFLLFSGHSKIIQQARGLCLIISPWNYPFYLTMMPLISAIAAGNRVIIKTSELSENTTKLLNELLNNHFDKNFVYVMDSSIEGIIEMLKNRFDFIFFTGSERAGTLVSQQAAKFHTPITLELGGKCPVIIADDIDLEYCATKIMSAKLINSGQTCVAPDYVVIEKGKADKFVDYCNKYVETHLSDLREFPKIISPLHYHRILNLLPDNVNIEHFEDMQKIYPKAFVSKWDSKAMQQEIFGPLLPVIEYDYFNEVVNKISLRSQPLSTYLFTKDSKKMDFISKNIKTGSLVINDLMIQLVSENLPFGGVGSSGNGRTHGYAGFLNFSNPVSFYRRKNFSTKLSEHPYTQSKLSIIKKILK
ncbi:aldehyde dehydrogenase family protein [Mycoplasma sp. HS2188]|uniref:aldehyde dehydrogenase family protein n=1 Tax=Mycoplasma sp. HS2188 TaxID=2976765 RepID=UPI0021AACE28|nr:aldehyde dehydrogenase family protein [Mycoplasma sp. HS2188]MCT4469500.1 aldehyde dehydrogenase family protein [Mycoplasma sp. HS2188]